MRLILLLFLANFIAKGQSASCPQEISPPVYCLLDELNGAHLRLSAIIEPPWFTSEVDSNGTITYKGYTVDIADYMTAALNATYSFVPIKLDEANEIGSRDAAINQLRHNEVDIIPRGLFLNIYHYSAMDCSLPIFYEAIQLLVPWPEEETRITIPIKPFQGKVWVCLAVSIVVVSLTLFLLQKCFKKVETNDIRNNKRGSNSLWNHLMYIVAGEGNWSQWNQFSFQLVQGAWCLAAIVLFNAYCSTLISYLVSPRLMPVAATYQDVASGYPQKLKWLTEKNEVLASFALKATSGPFKGLGDLLRQYPESLFTDREKGFELLFTGQYAYIQVQSRIKAYMAKAFEKSGRCKFTISNKNLDKISAMVFGFPKKWRYTEAFNYRMRWLAESGLVNYWIKRITPHTEDCNAEKTHKSDNDRRKVFSLNDLSGPFILLVFGLSLSLFVFLLEKLHYNFKLHRRNNS